MGNTAERCPDSVKLPHGAIRTVRQITVWSDLRRTNYYSAEGRLWGQPQKRSLSDFFVELLQGAIHQYQQMFRG